MYLSRMVFESIYLVLDISYDLAGIEAVHQFNILRTVLYQSPVLRYWESWTTRSRARKQGIQMRHPARSLKLRETSATIECNTVLLLVA